MPVFTFSNIVPLFHHTKYLYAINIVYPDTIVRVIMRIMTERELPDGLGNDKFYWHVGGYAEPLPPEDRVDMEEAMHELDVIIAIQKAEDEIVKS